MATKDIQKRGYNSQVATNKFLLATIDAVRDNAEAGDEFVLCTIPKGAFVESVIVVVDTTGITPAFALTDESGTINVTKEGNKNINKYFEDAQKVKLTLTDALDNGEIKVAIKFTDFAPNGNRRGVKA